MKIPERFLFSADDGVTWSGDDYPDRTSAVAAGRQEAGDPRRTIWTAIVLRSLIVDEKMIELLYVEMRKAFGFDPAPITRQETQALAVILSSALEGWMVANRYPLPRPITQRQIHCPILPGQS